MKKELLLPYDIQFFAEGEGEGEAGNGAEGSEPEAGAGEDEGGNETDPAEPSGEAEQPDQSGKSALYANARRRAEAEAKASYDRREAARNSRIAERFKGLTNPETGAPITTVDEYFEALDAQERAAARAQLQKNGVDPQVIDRAIANSPMMRQAQEALVQAADVNAQQKIREDFKAIMALDPSLTSEQDITGLPNFADMVRYVQQTGVSIVDAYKVVNYDRLMQNRTQAATQAAINSAKSKSHMAQIGGVAKQNEASDIPASELDMWKEWYPDKSMKELTKLYNQAMQAKGG